ncbi:MAG: hypothetical protein KGY69_19905, partial [Bacteroidales bacterium]|nr:hypothetical protein [Bacteroidales bacterium]
MKRREFIKKTGAAAFLTGMAGNIMINQAFAAEVNINKSKTLRLLTKAAEQGIIDFPKMDFNWGEGVMLEGMYYAYRQTDIQ